MSKISVSKVWFWIGLGLLFAYDTFSGATNIEVFLATLAIMSVILTHYMVFESKLTKN